MNVYNSIYIQGIAATDWSFCTVREEKRISFCRRAW